MGFVIERATAEQIRYIEILANDICESRLQRNAHISSLVGRTINYLDELGKYEATEVIKKYKELKEGAEEKVDYDPLDDLRK